MSNIILIVKGGVLQEITSDDMNNKFIVADYDNDPDLEIDELTPQHADNKMTAEQINYFKNY